jgi:hypothetical protein
MTSYGGPESKSNQPSHQNAILHLEELERCLWLGSHAAKTKHRHMKGPFDENLLNISSSLLLGIILSSLLHPYSHLLFSLLWIILPIHHFNPPPFHTHSPSFYLPPLFLLLSIRPAIYSSTNSLTFPPHPNLEPSHLALSAQYLTQKPTPSPMSSSILSFHPFKWVEIPLLLQTL